MGKNTRMRATMNGKKSVIKNLSEKAVSRLLVRELVTCSREEGTASEMPDRPKQQKELKRQENSRVSLAGTETAKGEPSV